MLRCADRRTRLAVVLLDLRDAFESPAIFALFPSLIPVSSLAQCGWLVNGATAVTERPAKAPCFAQTSRLGRNRGAPFLKWDRSLDAAFFFEEAAADSIGPSAQTMVPLKRTPPRPIS